MRMRHKPEQVIVKLRQAEDELARMQHAHEGFVQFGLQHGVLRLDLRMDGELVIKTIPDIGYLHTGMEKLFEYKKYEERINDYCWPHHAIISLYR